MKNKIKNICISATLLVLTSCGGGSGGTTPSTGGSNSTNNINSGGTTSNPNTPPPVSYGSNAVGVLQTGLMKNAEVTIHEISPSGRVDRNPLFKETTTAGDINHAGYFNTHSSELKDNSYYLYKYVGRSGVALDMNMDGKQDPHVDNYPEGEYDSVSVVVKGEWIKQLGNKVFRITYLSDLISNKLKYTAYSTSGYEDKYQPIVQKYIKNDINSDGIIDMKDVISFNPLINLKDTVGEYRNVIWKNIVIAGRVFMNMHMFSKVREVGSVDVNCGEAMYGIVKDDTRVLVDGSKFTMIDTTDVTSMSVLGELDKNIEFIEFSKNKNTVYALTKDKSKSYLNRSFVSIDISTDSPQLNYEISNNPNEDLFSYRFSNDKSRLYLIKRIENGSPRYLEIYDISETQATLLKRHEISSKASDLYISENKNILYVVEDYDNALNIIREIDISNLNSIQIKGKGFETVSGRDLFSQASKAPYVNEAKNTMFVCSKTKLIAYKEK